MQRVLVFVIFLLLFSIFSIGSLKEIRLHEPPRILGEFSSPKQFKTGENFKLECDSNRPIHWSYPKQSLINEKDDVTVSNSKNSESFRSVINVNSANFLDTGYYRCIIDGTVFINDTENVASTYIYVKDLKHLLVKNESVTICPVKPYQRLVIPCRPSTLEAKVSLWEHEKEIHVGKQKDNMNVKYDPTIGYILDGVNKTQGRPYTYKCIANLGNDMDDLTYIVHVLKITTSIREPSINESAVLPVLTGQVLYLECVGKADRDVRYSIKWEIPNESNRVNKTEAALLKNCGTNTYNCHKSSLTIRDVKHEDAGNYTCNVIDHNGLNNSNTQEIKVYDPGVDFINLTDHGLNFTVPTGVPNVTWVIHVDAPSRPTFQWFNQLDQEVVPDTSAYTHKYNITVTKGFQQVMLVVYKVTIQDAGTYRFIVHLNSVTKQLNFTLNVKDKPSLTIGGKKELYHELGAMYFVNYTVVGYPSPEILWSFISCDAMENCNETNSRIIEHITDLVLDNRQRFISKLPLKVTESGILECYANNTEGEEISRVSIFVTDIPQQGSFPSLWRDTVDEVVEGDTVKIYCGTTKYEYYSNILWYLKRIGYEDKLEIHNQSDVHIITRHDSAYSYIEELTLINVKMGSDANYTCEVKRQDNGLMKYKETVINILASTKPELLSSNLNGTDLLVNTFSIVQLYCKAKGLPKPTIEWFKNDKPLLNDSHIRISGANMTIQYANLDDEGEYRCDISNRIGKLSRNLHLKFKDKSGVYIGLVIGIVICGIVLAIMIAVLFMKIRREKKLREELNVAGLANFVQGAMESINPEMSVDEQAELLPYDKKWEFPRVKLKLGKQLGAGAFGVVMKAEAWGILDGEMKTIVAVKMVKRNADRTYIKALASELKIMIHLGKHLNVVNLLGACTKNLARMELLVIVEYCRFGNLQNYLLRHREEFVDQIDPRTGEIDPTIGTDIIARKESMRSRSRLKLRSLSSSSGNSGNTGGIAVHYQAAYPAQSTGTTTVESDNESNLISFTPTGERDEFVFNSNGSQPEWRLNYRGDYKGARPICTHDLLCWAFQVARGMEYLVSRKVLHGDLAARNILLADDNIVKICDFGLAKSMYKSDNYRKKGDGPLPIKWMAIESIRDRVFSTQSDVWSFGVVLWEFFSLARTPYTGMEVDEKLYNKLVDGYRMEKPDYATADIYEVMLNCWETNPDQRPSFLDLAERLGNKLEDSVRRRYIDLNDPYMNINAEWLQGLQNDYLSMMNSPTYRNMVSPTCVDEEAVGNPYVNGPHHIQPSSEETEDSGYLCMKNSSPEEVIFSPRLKQSNIFRFSPHLQNQRRLRNEEADGVNGPEQKSMLKAGRNNSESDTEMDDMEKGSSKKGKGLASDIKRDDQAPEGKTTSFSNPNYQLVKPPTPSNDNYVNIPQQNMSKFGKLRMPSESLSTNSEFSELYPSPSNLSGEEPMKFGNEMNSRSPLHDRIENSFSNPNYQSLIKIQNDAFSNVPNHNRRVSDASSGFQSDAGESLLVI